MFAKAEQVADAAYLTQDEAVRYVRVSKTAFRRHVHPHVPVYKIGRRKLYKSADLDAYMTESTHTPAKAIRRRPKAAAIRRSSCEVANLARELEDNA